MDEQNVTAEVPAPEATPTDIPFEEPVNPTPVADPTPPDVPPTDPTPPDVPPTDTPSEPEPPVADPQTDTPDVPADVPTPPAQPSLLEQIVTGIAHHYAADPSISAHVELTTQADGRVVLAVAPHLDPGVALIVSINGRAVWEGTV